MRLSDWASSRRLRESRESRAGKTRKAGCFLSTLPSLPPILTITTAMPSIEARGSRQRQGKPTPALAALIDRNDAALPADVDGRGDFALLPPALWGRLFPASSSSPEQRQFIAVTFPAQQSPEAAGKTVNVTYAATCLQQDLEGQDPTSATHPIFLSFLPYGYSRQQPTLATATPLRPLPISSVILSTSSRSIVREASSSTFRDGLAGTLVRQGHLVRLPQGRLRAVQCEPVLQGVVDASTQVLVVHDAGFDDGDDDEASYAEGSATGAGAGQEDVERDLAGLSIDERFLANSVLEDFDDEADEVDELQHDLAPGLPNGHPPEAARSARSHASDAGIEAWPIANRQALMQAIAQWQSRQEGGRSEVDEESAMLLQEEKLAAIGGFDGDWVSARRVNARRWLAADHLTSSCSAGSHRNRRPITTTTTRPHFLLLLLNTTTRLPPTSAPSKPPRPRLFCAQPSLSTTPHHHAHAPRSERLFHSPRLPAPHPIRRLPHNRSRTLSPLRQSRLPAAVPRCAQAVL